MGKRHSGNASSLGTGSHLVKIYDRSPSGKTTRRSRTKCIHYCQEIKTCNKLNIGCVGPSNPLCKDYCEKVITQAPRPRIAINTIVNSPKYGIGMILDIKTPIYEVKFQKDNITRTLSKKEIKRMLLK